MDSALIPQNQHHHHHSTTASKLPIKRKNPDPTPTHHHLNEGRPPPFKFHRIWTEPDEIRFLQGLLDCSSQNLSFPRDLGIFYARFSNTMKQPYTKSQLSEKIRRLRKKFRVISTRLSKGLEISQLSIHDRALFDLSKKLWHPDYAATSPFNGARNVVGTTTTTTTDNSADNNGFVDKSSLVGIKVDFSPTLPAMIMSDFDYDNDVNLELDFTDNTTTITNINSNENVGSGEKGGVLFDDFCFEDNKIEEEEEGVKLSEVNVEFEGIGVVMEQDEEDDEVVEEEEENDGRGVEEEEEENVEFGIEKIKVGEVAAKVVMDVFDECVKDARRGLANRAGGGECSGETFRVRWQEQRMAELDVFGSRLRLVLEQSLQKQ